MTDTGAIIANRKARWESFYDLTSPQRFLLMVQYSTSEPARPWPYAEYKQARIEWAWLKYQRQLGLLDWLDDDALPYLDVFTGTEIFAEAFGCPVHRPPNDMPFAMPLINNAAEVSKIKIPDYSATPLAMLFEIADELRRRAGSEALVKLVDTQSPMDIAALIWDKNTFYTALIETPEPVLELADKVGQLFTRFLDDWYARYGKAFIAHYPDYYMPQGVTLSEDEVGAVSGAIFQRYFLPELTGLSNRYGGMGVHCCANSRHQWEGFSRIPNLRLLNLNQPAPILEDAQRFFARRVTQMHDWPVQPVLHAGSQQFPDGAHIVLRPAAENRSQALELVETYKRLYTA